MNISKKEKKIPNCFWKERNPAYYYEILQQHLNNMNSLLIFFSS